MFRLTSRILRFSLTALIFSFFSFSPSILCALPDEINNFSSTSDTYLRSGDGGLSIGQYSVYRWLKVGSIDSTAAGYAEFVWDMGEDFNANGAQVRAGLYLEADSPILNAQFRLEDWANNIAYGPTFSDLNASEIKDKAATVNGIDFSMDSGFDAGHVRYIGVRFYYPGGQSGTNFGNVDYIQLSGHSTAETPEPHIILIASLALLGFCFHRGNLPWNAFAKKNIDAHPSAERKSKE